MGGVWLVVRTDLCRRWSSIVALTILLALAGAFVVTAATGARRADSALERLLDATEMWDGSIEVDFPSIDAVVADVAAQPEVAVTSAFGMLPLVSDEIETFLIAGLAPGWLRDVYVPRVIAGRLPDPARVDELLVNEDIAERHHLVPGDEVVFHDILGLGIAQTMTIVGVHRGVLDLAFADRYPGAIATEAFGSRFGDTLYDAAEPEDAQQFRPQIVARTRGDVAELIPVLDAVADRHAAARPRVTDRSQFVSPIDRSLAVQVEAFWILTVASGVSALLLLGIAVARLASSGTHQDATLSALGFGPGPRALATLAVPMVVVVLGCLLALVGAVVASPLVPLGSARLVEPDPGIWADPTTLLVGALVLAAGLGAIAIAAVLVGTPDAGRKPQTSRSVVQLPLPATVGRDLAYRESGWGRLALAATGVGLGLVVSVAVYMASVDRLRDTSSLFGSDYDVLLFGGDGVAPEEAFTDIDLDDPAIESAAISRVAQLTVAGELVEAQVIDPVRGVAGGTVLRGRAPRAEDEVVLGPTTVDRLGLGIGEDVTLVGARERSMRIVGEAVLPLLGQGAHGDVVWVSQAAADRLEAVLYESWLLLRLAEGVTHDDLEAAIGDSGETVRVPVDVSNLDGVGQIPAVLAIFGALLSSAVLVLALVGIVRRRRHDLAILRTLGLLPTQIRGALFSACLFIVGPGAVAGLAIGVMLGRAYWSSVARGVPAVAQPVVPLAATAIVVLGALVACCLLVAVPIRLGTRIRPTEILPRD